MSFTEAAGPFQGRRRGSTPVDYPVRFFNMMHFDIPKSHREILKWCRLFFRSSGFVRDVIDKLSRYPVTPISCVGNDQDDDSPSKWQDILNKQLHIREQLVSINMHRNTFGNCFVSMIPLFNRFLQCPKCGAYNINPIEKTKYTFREFKFHGKCNGCKNDVTFKVKDEYKKDAKEDLGKQLYIRIWPTESIHVKFNNVTGARRIMYKLNSHEVKGIRSGDKFYLETMPYDFIEAVKLHGDKAGITLDPDKTMWFKAEDLEDPDSDHGMALPFFFSSWKTLWQIFIHRKAQECIVSDHMLPYRVIYPMTQTANADPISAIDLGQWKANVGGLIQRWYNDPNEIGEMPFPLGFQQLGGNGKSMSLIGDIENLYRLFLIENGIPAELIFGGMTWSGSSVTLRMLENRFLYDVGQDNLFLSKIVDFISDHFDILKPKDVRLSPFKMADDIAKINLYSSLNAQGKISNQRMLGTLGDEINFKDETKTIVNERLDMSRALGAIQGANASAAAEAGRISQEEQVKTTIAAQDLQNKLTPTLQSSLSAPVSIMTPQGMARYVLGLPDDERAMELNSIQQINPSYYQQIVPFLGTGVDPSQSISKPLPEQRPPQAQGVNARI